LDQKSKRKSTEKELKNRELSIIKNRILHFSLHYGEYLENRKEDEIFDFIENTEESLLVEGILELLEFIEDNPTFMKIFVFLEDSVQLNTLPSRIIDLLFRKENHDGHFYRLLLLYQTFFDSGYVLKQSYEKLLEELNLNPEKVGREIIKIVEGLDIEDNDEIRQELRGILDTNKLIDEIKPINNFTPFNPEITGELFTFPKGIDTGIKKHLSRLDEIYNSPRKKIEFTKSASKEILDPFSEAQDNKLMQDALNFYYDGIYDRALNLLNKLIKKYPRNALPIYFRAKIEQIQGNLFQALKDILKSIDLDPYKIEPYKYLSHLLEIGGYFYSSTVLTCNLLRFCPFDFNFHLQLAITSYQLLKPYKNPLILAGKMDPARLINFISRYWIHNRIKPRDDLNDIKATEIQFNEIRMSAENLIIKAIEVLGQNTTPFQKNREKFASIIKDPSYFFPTMSDYVLKNWFVYELTRRFFLNFNQFYINLTPLLASNKFIQLFFEISKTVVHFILAAFKNRTKITINIIEEFFKKNMNRKFQDYFNLLTFFTSNTEIFRLINSTITQFIEECRECPNQCLRKPNKWCLAFFEFGSNNSKEMNDRYSILIFIDGIISDLEYYLEEKGLLQKTIDKKVENAEFMFEYIIDNRNFKDYKELEDIMNEGLITEFLCQCKDITSKTKMKQKCTSLKNLISLLYHNYGFYQDGSFSKLNKLLTNSDHFFESSERTRYKKTI